MAALPRISLGDLIPEELDFLYEIEVASYPNPWPYDAFRRELNLPFSRILAARNNGPEGPPLAGYCVLWVVRDEAHILNLAVHPDARRQGVASTMLRGAIDSAKSQGARILYLEVRRSNDAAQKLYAGFGFKQVGVRPRYYEDNREDALVMLLEMVKAAP
jgi:[ribosomal protein S18]-alanine N-acetyltransferase